MYGFGVWNNNLNGSLMRKCNLYDILYVPEVMYNLLSMSKAIEKGINFESERIIKEDNQRAITIQLNGKPLPCDIHYAKESARL